MIWDSASHLLMNFVIHVYVLNSDVDVDVVYIKLSPDAHPLRFMSTRIVSPVKQNFSLSDPFCLIPLYTYSVIMLSKLSSSVQSSFPFHRTFLQKSWQICMYVSSTRNSSSTQSPLKSTNTTELPIFVPISFFILPFYLLLFRTKKRLNLTRLSPSL